MGGRQRRVREQIGQSQFTTLLRAPACVTTKTRKPTGLAARPVYQVRDRARGRPVEVLPDRTQPCGA